MNFRKRFTSSVVLFFLLFISCETDDILSAISFELSDTVISEDGDTITFGAQLNSSAANTITIDLNFGGSATINEDYTVSANSIIINSGQDYGEITITGLEDDLIEGDEDISITVVSASNALIPSGTDTNFTVVIRDADVDTDGDGIADTEDECPNTPGPAENNGCPYLGFLINEVLYDPPSGNDGDANGDGTRSALDDEFIEFFNSAAEPLDLSGYTISDSDQIRHEFPDGSIVPANGTLVVFGGGDPTGTFGGAIVVTASTGQLNMSNAGDLMTLADANGNPVLVFDIEPLSNNPDESYSRNPDFTGDFVQHTSITEGGGRLFSPGTRVDGSDL